MSLYRLADGVAWVLVTDDGTQPVVTLHATERSAFDTLRANFATGEDVPDDELRDHVTRQGVYVLLEEAHVTGGAS